MPPAMPRCAAGQYVLVAVTDTGTGMPPEVAARRSIRSSPPRPVGKGTGLGLSQVFGFVKQSGGHVKIYSELGQGTTVKIYLPRYFGEDEPRARDGPRSPRPAPARRILVVEDDDRVRLSDGRCAARTRLHRRCTPAMPPKRCASSTSTPTSTLLFTDIVMPGMNGRKLADEALQARPGLKLLFTTGFTRNAVVHNGVLDPGVNFLAKPFTIDQLADKVREVLDS